MFNKLLVNAMKHFKYLPTLLFLPMIYIIVFTTGCETTNDPGGGGGNDSTLVDSAASVAKYNQGYALLESEFHYLVNAEIKNTSDLDILNFKPANDLFKEAIKLNPNNKPAQFGAALTEILIAYADTSIKRLIKDFETWGNSNQSNFLSSTIIPIETKQMQIPLVSAAFNIAAMHKIAVTDPPLISRIQSVLKNNFLPKIDYALARLAIAEADPNFKFVVSGKMQGDPTLQSVTIYPAELLLTSAMLYGIKFPIESFLIYKFELNDYSQGSLVAALQQNSTTFFYLASDGTQHATNAKNSMQTMITKMRAAITSIKTISGSKPDAIIKIGNDGISQADLDTLDTYLTKVQNAFTQNISVELKDADSDGNDYTININLGNFFNNPVQNPKQAYFPAYNVTPAGTDDIKFDFVAQTYDDFIFPDPTFNGLFPGMTNETLKRILHIDEAFGFRLNGNARYEGGTNSWWNPVSSATVKIITETNQTYTTTTRDDGDFKIIVRDATANGPKITQLFINYGQGETELAFSGYKSEVRVSAKSEEHFDIVIVRKPENLSATVYTNPIQVNLQWNVNGFTYGSGNYAIERMLTGGSFAKIDSGYFSSYNYTDFNVTAGQTYTYRIRTAPVPYYYGDYFSCYLKNQLYSNSVVITP